MKSPKLPKYVRMMTGESNPVLCLEKDKKGYYRTAGNWSVGFFVAPSGQMMSFSTLMKDLNGVELKPATKKEHDDSNRGYL